MTPATDPTCDGTPVVSLFSPEEASRLLGRPVEALPPAEAGGYTFAELRRLQPAARTPRPKVHSAATQACADAEQLFQRARRLGKRPDAQARAAALYEQAIALAPMRADLHVGLGNVRHRQGDRDAAEQLYRRAVALDNDHAEQHYGLGVLLFERGAFEEAERSLREAQDIDPDWADPYPYLALAAYALGRREDAIAVLELYVAMVRGRRRADAQERLAVLRRG